MPRAFDTRGCRSTPPSLAQAPTWPKLPGVPALFLFLLAPMKPNPSAANCSTLLALGKSEEG
jgi:hypothetical protein